MTKSTCLTRDQALISEMSINILTPFESHRKATSAQGGSVDKYNDTADLRHKIMRYIAQECEPEVEMMLIHVLGDYAEHLNCFSGVLCHSEKQLILLGANKYKNPWTREYRERKIKKMILHSAELRQMKKDLDALIAHPNPKFRNNRGPNKPALVFEAFQRLPLELRLHVWRYLVFEKVSIITLDANVSTNKCLKMVRILPSNSSDQTSIPLAIPSKNPLLKTTREARQAVLDGMDSHIYVDRVATPSDRTRKLLFNRKVGDILFINHLKSCGASFSAAGFQHSPKSSSLGSITTLAIHDKNFFMWGLGTVNDDVEFAKIADILSKFTSLAKLLIVLGTSNSKCNLPVDTKLEEVSGLGNAEMLINWSTRAFNLGTLRTLFATYAANRPGWKVPELALMRVSNPNIAREPRLRKDEEELKRRELIKRGAEIVLLRGRIAREERTDQVNREFLGRLLVPGAPVMETVLASADPWSFLVRS
ncbi:hypothetical protein ACEPPN_018714 [Leptodophora sp. 'Broadleaf-Isolate-01']